MLRDCWSIDTPFILILFCSFGCLQFLEVFNTSYGIQLHMQDTNFVDKRIDF